MVESSLRSNVKEVTAKEINIKQIRVNQDKVLLVPSLGVVSENILTVGGIGNIFYQLK